jgi:O-antigen/teichoic acid export membrane protein
MQDLEETRRLYLSATWSMLFATILLFVPITVLFPDFLRLWLGPEFARESARIGQVLAASCIVRGALVPQQGLFLGLGKPQYVTTWYLGSTVLSLGLNLLLIPRYGLAGAGYAFAITPVWGFMVLIFAWSRVLGSRSLRPLLRAVALPSLLAALSLALGLVLRASLPEPGWIELFMWGGVLIVWTGGLVLGTEWLLGGRGSHTVTLVHSVGRLALSGPWMKLAKSRLGNRA